MTKIIYAVTSRRFRRRDLGDMPVNDYGSNAGLNAVLLSRGGIRFETFDGKVVLELDREAWNRIHSAASLGGRWQLGYLTDSGDAMRRAKCRRS